LESIVSSWDPTTSGWDKIGGAMEMNQCFYDIQLRTMAIFKSYYFLIFYYEVGIPDKRWFISPGRKRESIEYYPDFQKVHYSIKSWFDFFTDTFYHELFSAWDMVGHFLNVKYDLGLKDVYFTTAIDGLSEKNSNLYNSLIKIKDSTAYKLSKKIRNNIVHNSPPNIPGMTVYRSNHSGTFGRQFAAIGLKEYIPSDEIVINIREVLELFEATLLCLQGSANLDRGANPVDKLIDDDD
jgi:hypothetical protein